MNPQWRDDVPALRRSRPREATPSGIVYGYCFRDFVNQPESRFIRLHRWWEDCTSDPLFWRILGWGIIVGVSLVLAVFL